MAQREPIIATRFTRLLPLHFLHHALPTLHLPPNFRRDAAAKPTRATTILPTMATASRRNEPMRKTLIALAATTGLIGLGAAGASAAPLAPVHAPQQVSSIQQADWYCGPRCQYWHHRRWEERRAWRWEHRYYGYNNPYHYYYR
jgi:hypothetical protein